ncbi:helix-turn-helix domain-containing protein [Flagellimonas olearia]|uniref:HTH araC/xylS-type domain-containing protein n=1 Tax=Flagellimonas olearia TaxID=552546 RepID=A0A444VNH0_9FLAO|nr:AraC family transcriptional regulator [Allomuricauda olearia]RYC52323.1 hypothetical protein DN53_10600 [Allomuricauda olearia]
MKLLVDFILVSGIVLTLIILFLLFKKNQKEQLPNTILVVFFFLLLFVSLSYYGQLHRIKWLYVVSFLPEDTIVWFVGPLLMLYIKSLFLRPKGLVKRHILQFIPFLIYTLSISVPLWLSVIKGEYVFKNLGYMEDHIVLPVLMVGNIYLLGYMVFCLKLVNRYQSLIKHNYSTFTEHDFSWIKNLLIGSMAVISIDLFTGLYYFITEKELVILGSSDGHLTILAMVILVAYLGYHGVGQSRMLLPEFLLAQNEEPLEKMVKEEKKSNTHPLLSDEELKNLEGRFHTVLVEQKLYLDENLTLGKIASLMDTTDKKLSFFINHHLHTTFYDLINKERVAMVKTQLHEKALQQYTLLGIAHNSGFKSKTSFNRIFKKETGLSPSEYVKQFKLKH